MHAHQGSSSRCPVATVTAELYLLVQEWQCRWCWAHSQAMAKSLSVIVPAASSNSRQQKDDHKAVPIVWYSLHIVMVPVTVELPLTLLSRPGCQPRHSPIKTLKATQSQPSIHKPISHH